MSEYHSKIVGTTFEGRQDVIASLKGDEPLRVRREPENEYDPKAVAVDVWVETSTPYHPDNDMGDIGGGDWIPVGYIARDKNSDIAQTLDSGKDVDIKISEVTGGGEKNYGMNIFLSYTKPKLQRLTAFVGGEIDYDEELHTYSWKGEVYLSGSQYAKQFEKPFDKAGISNAMAKKWGVDAQDILDMWELKARTSREFGTALHSALQLYGQYDGLARKLEKATHLHDHPVIKQAVESFYEGRKGEKAEYEIVVVDHKAKRAGRIDRLLITGDKRCRIQDYKVLAVSKPEKLAVYKEQLKFYAEIMEANGWVCEGNDIFVYDGRWKNG